jgi:hypothetical protein
MATRKPAVTREEWLIQASKLLAKELFTPVGLKVPAKLRVSVGQPFGRGSKGSAIGQCWFPESSADAHHELFVSPTLSDPLRILDVLTHELLHAALPLGTGHRGKFLRGCALLGLEGKPTATVAGSDLAKTLKRLRRQLPRLKHGALSAASGPRKQGTRQLKCECPKCGYIARTTAKWLEQAGPPICPACEEALVLK